MSFKQVLACCDAKTAAAAAAFGGVKITKGGSLHSHVVANFFLVATNKRTKRHNPILSLFCVSMSSYHLWLHILSNFRIFALNWTSEWDLFACMLTWITDAFRLEGKIMIWGVTRKSCHCESCKCMTLLSMCPRVLRKYVSCSCDRKRKSLRKLAGSPSRLVQYCTSPKISKKTKGRDVKKWRIDRRYCCDIFKYFSSRGSYCCWELTLSLWILVFSEPNKNNEQGRRRRW